MSTCVICTNKHIYSYICLLWWNVIIYKILYNAVYLLMIFISMHFFHFQRETHWIFANKRQFVNITLPTASFASCHATLLFIILATSYEWCPSHVWRTRKIFPVWVLVYIPRIGQCDRLCHIQCEWEWNSAALAHLHWSANVIRSLAWSSPQTKMKQN